MSLETTVPVGWDVPVGWRFATVVVCAPAALFGVLGFFSLVGLPFILVSIVAIHRCLSSHTSTNGTPEDFLFVLAALEMAPAVFAVVFVGPLGIVCLLPSIATAIVAVAVRSKRQPILPGPPRPSDMRMSTLNR